MRSTPYTVGMLRIPTVVSPGTTPPKYQTSGAAGVDLTSTISYLLQPMERKLIPTGLKVAIPEGFEGQVRPRSGLALRHGISMVNSPGTIDSDYRGEVGVILINMGTEAFEIQPGDRIGQLVISPVVQANFDPVEDLDDTERGTGGFGSTGRQ